MVMKKVGRASGGGKASGATKARGARRTSGVGGASRAGRVRTTAPAGTVSEASKARKAASGASQPRTPRLPKAVAAVVEAVRDKKGEHIVVLDLRKTAGFTDYFVICTGANARQIAAIADAVRDTLRETLGERPALAEGVDKSEWILLDYFNFVVHVFSRECRTFYDLERLWGNAERYELNDVT